MEKNHLEETWGAFLEAITFQEEALAFQVGTFLLNQVVASLEAFLEVE